MAKQGKLDAEWKLTPKQALFVVEYLKDLNQVQAAIRAGYSEASAENNAHRLMEVEGIKQAIASATAKRLNDLEITNERILRELACIAFINAKSFYDDHGNLKPVSQWTDEMGAAVGSIETILKNAEAGDGIIDRVFKFRKWSKEKALEMLMKHRGMLEDKLKITGDVEIVPTRLAGARKRLAEHKAKAKA